MSVEHPPPRLRNLPMGFAKMMRYSDWANAAARRSSFFATLKERISLI